MASSRLFCLKTKSYYKYVNVKWFTHDTLIYIIYSTCKILIVSILKRGTLMYRQWLPGLSQSDMLV